MMSTKRETRRGTLLYARNQLLGRGEHSEIPSVVTLMRSWLLALECYTI